LIGLRSMFSFRGGRFSFYALLLASALLFGSAVLVSAARSDIAGAAANTPAQRRKRDRVGTLIFIRYGKLEGLQGISQCGGFPTESTMFRAFRSGVNYVLWANPFDSALPVTVVMACNRRRDSCRDEIDPEDDRFYRGLKPAASHSASETCFLVRPTVRCRCTDFL
jgi:hypothetical protein